MFSSPTRGLPTRRVDSLPKPVCKVPTLQQLVIDQLRANIRSIDDIGDLEYRLCRPFLGLVRSPEQLHEIEENSPQLIGEDGEIWQKIIFDRFNEDPESILPDEDNDWYSVYLQHEAIFKHKKESDVLALKAQFSQLSAEKSKKRAVLINDTPALQSKRRGTSSWGSSSSSTPRISKSLNALEKARKEASVYNSNIQRAVSHVKAGGPKPVRIGLTPREYRPIEFSTSKIVGSAPGPGISKPSNRAKAAEQVAKERARKRLGEDRVIAAPRLGRVNTSNSMEGWNTKEKEVDKNHGRPVGIKPLERKRTAPDVDLKERWGDIPFMRRINGLEV